MNTQSHMGNPTQTQMNTSQTAGLAEQEHQPEPTTSSKISFRPTKIRKVLAPPKGQNQRQPQPSPSATLRIVPAFRSLSSDAAIAAALQHLRAADPQLAHLIDTHHPPTFHNIQSPFQSLARSILYQQLAFKAAASIYSRFLSLCGGESGVSPAAILNLTPHQLRQIGISGRKASYLHDLASKFNGGIISDASILDMDDKSLLTTLTMVKGIGVWSVHMFMIFSLHRPDVLPVGDLGVRKGVQLLYGLDQLPRPSQMEKLCERWRPYRSVGSWYMWRLVETKGTPASTPTLPAPTIAGAQVYEPTML